ncbi:MAG: ABC transporter substrate-binding protein [Hydrogenophaga sp.]|jgi:NitT/TauT family transport system substrate-binding protein|nr:ABC transporter substrate-binding protein [Hydrogenophaga sp.]
MFAPTSLRRWVACTFSALALSFMGAASAQTAVKFSLNFKPDGSNAAWFLAQEKGYFRDAGLQVTLDASNGTGDVLSRLGNNSYDFGFADIGALMEFAARNPQQAPVAVLAIYANSPLSIVALRKSGISGPKDLTGRKLGGPATDGAYRMLPAFARATGLDTAQLRTENIDIRVRETLLFRGDLDAIAGFDSSIWFNLKAMGVKQEDVVFMRYADQGLDLYGNALMVSRKMLETNPEAVRAFVRATALGWRDALANPAEAIEAVARRDPLINKAIEIEKLQWLLQNQVRSPLSERDGLGAVDLARLERQIETVSTVFGLPTKPAVAAIYDARFLPPVADRRLP